MCLKIVLFLDIIDYIFYWDYIDKINIFQKLPVSINISYFANLVGLDVC